MVYFKNLQIGYVQMDRTGNSKLTIINIMHDENDTFCKPTVLNHLNQIQRK